MTRVLKKQTAKKYFKIIMICFFTTITLKSYSQSLKTFADENTTYTYYIDSISGEKIKHGSYKSIEKKDTYSRIVTSNYKKGLPNGIYTVEEKAEKNKHFYPNAYSETGYSKATINLKVGIPNGQWTYSRNWTINDLVVNYVQRDPGKENISLTMQFCDGRPCGVFDCYYDANTIYEMLVKSSPLNLTNNMKFEATLKGKTLGQYNNDGLAIGKWTFDNGKLIVNFNNGVLIEVLEKFESTSGKYVENNQDEELKTLSKKYSNKEIAINELKQKLVKVDTIYMFEKSSFNFFNTDNDDFGRLIILTRFQKPNFNELLDIRNDGTSNKSSVELTQLFDEWGSLFTIDEEKKYSQLILTAKANEEQERIKQRNEEIRLKEIEEQKRKAQEIELIRKKQAEELDKQNTIVFEKYKLLQKKYQEIKELPTILEFNLNSESLSNSSGNFQNFYSFLYSFVSNSIKKQRVLEQELGKVNYLQFNPTYNYSSYSTISYSLDSIYRKDSLRIQKINEVYFPEYECLQLIVKQYNGMSELFDQINRKMFDLSYIESKPNSPELHSAIFEILNSDMDKLKSDSFTLKTKEETISKLTMVLKTSITLLTENNKKIKSALKKAATVEEKQNIILTF